MKKTINNELKLVGTLDAKGNLSNLKQSDSVTSVKICETYDLDKFVVADWNRNIRTEKTKSLSERMKIFFLSFTIVVNEFLEIIDGQHRLHALKIYNEYRISVGLKPIPLRYEIKVGWGMKECKELNSETSPFSNEDILKQEVYNGNENYVLYKEFKKEYPFLGHNTIIGLLSGNIKATKGGENKSFKLGTFKVKDYQESIELTNKIIEIVETGIIPLGDRGNPQTTYTLSILPFIVSEKYDHQLMIKQINNRNKYTKDSLPESTKLTTCKYYLQKLYNNDIDKKDKISILSKPQMYKEELKKENG
tara:strand:- start:743 stop:1660 length:918 start_codon:yes stop_codon:yes gene_type:complete